MSGRRAYVWIARFLVIGLACAAVWLSLVGRSRVWLHSTGRLHFWYHLILFGLLAALAVRGSRRSWSRIVLLGGLLMLGLAMESWEARGSLAAIEWADVQADCWGAGFGCLAAWLLSSESSKAR